MNEAVWTSARMILTSVFETTAPFFGYAGKETGGTNVRSSLIVFDAVVKLENVVTTSRASGFGMVTVEYKYLGFTVEVFGGQGKVLSLWRHIDQATNGMICVVNRNNRSPVVDARMIPTRCLMMYCAMRLCSRQRARERN